jgi:hypothetical protein
VCAAVVGCGSWGGAGPSGPVDAGHGVDAAAPAEDGGAVRDPEVVRWPDGGIGVIPALPTGVIEIPAGDGEGRVAVTAGGGEELPRGPESFDVDAEGNVWLLDAAGGAVKVFGPQGAYVRAVDLGGDGPSFIDLSVSRSGELALAQAAASRVHVLPKAATALAQASRQVGLLAAAPFDGVSFDATGALYARTAGQWTYAVDGDQGNPYLALLSMHAPLFVRVRRLGPSLGILYASAAYDAGGYTGNAQKVFEIAPKVSIGSISFIDADAKGRAYLHLESVGETAEGAIDVRRYVMRVGAAPADWAEPFEIPTDTHALPFRDLRVGADGTVYAMLVYADKVKVMRWTAE